MAGLVAAVAAARRGCSVMLVHDRPVLGGNASSEVRMWICGAAGKNRKEAGILDEIQLTNLHRNPEGMYSVWDSVLFEYGKMTPGLSTLMNCSCNDARMEDGHLVSIDAWQLTTQTWHRVEAKFFIDCSGDSILAPLSGAKVRWGREAQEEFNESIAPLKKDLKTMGNTILLQLEETDRPQKFTPPNWAYTFDEQSTLPSRAGNGFGHNFWWLELGGLLDTIKDSETIRDELVKAAWGVWDYMKNRGPQAEKLKNWRLRWLGALPGKRENRRYVGDYTLTQNDVEAEGKFEDIVAYGGWSMDDHHPAGLYYPGAPTIFHPAPSPYGIPFRSLYSVNIPNLLCAGRNLSATHCALSSTRVMGTCALLGQAVGTAAALCKDKSVMPADIKGPLLQALQQHLMDDDCWLPWKERQQSSLLQRAEITDSAEGRVEALKSSEEREVDDAIHHWAGNPGDSITLSWPHAEEVSTLRMVFDSNLHPKSKTMPCRYPLEAAGKEMPKCLVKSFRVEYQSESGAWETLFEENENKRRLFVLPVKKRAKAIRWTGLSTWGDSQVKVFSIEPRSDDLPISLDPDNGKSWVEVISSLDPEHLKEPDNGMEGKGSHHVGA